jgi:hypothetical protein
LGVCVPALQNVVVLLHIFTFFGAFPRPETWFSLYHLFRVHFPGLKPGASLTSFPRGLNPRVFQFALIYLHITDGVVSLAGYECALTLLFPQ